MMISMDFGAIVNKHDLETLRSRLVGLNSNDEITIRVAAAAADNTDLIAAELTQQGFDWQPHGSRDGQDYYLVARKMS